MFSSDGTLFDRLLDYMVENLMSFMRRKEVYGKIVGSRKRITMLRSKGAVFRVTLHTEKLFVITLIISLIANIDSVENIFSALILL